MTRGANLPTYNPKRDGNVFEWILKETLFLRKRLSSRLPPQRTQEPKRKL